MIEIDDPKELAQLWSSLDITGRKHVYAYFSQRLSMLRRTNDDPALSLEKTAVLRGAILECKRVLQSVVPPPMDDDGGEDRPNSFA